MAAVNISLGLSVDIVPAPYPSMHLDVDTSWAGYAEQIGGAALYAPMKDLLPRDVPPSGTTVALQQFENHLER